MSPRLLRLVWFAAAVAARRRLEAWFSQLVWADRWSAVSANVWTQHWVCFLGSLGTWAESVVNEDSLLLFDTCSSAQPARSR